MGMYPAAVAALRFLYLATAAEVACTYCTAPSTWPAVGAVLQFGVCMACPVSVTSPTEVSRAVSPADNGGPLYFQLGLVTPRPAIPAMFIELAVPPLANDPDLPFTFGTAVELVAPGELVEELEPEPDPDPDMVMCCILAAVEAANMQHMTMSGSGSGSGSSSSTSSPGATSSTAVPNVKGRSGSLAKGGTANSMNMAGMAGLGVTNPNWKYSGPPLSAGETALLTSVGDVTDTGHAMQTPNCSTAPTAGQVLGAVQYVQATSAAVAKYKNLSAATAAGYIPITSSAYPVVHYLNLSYMNNQDILDPNHVDSLVYAFTPNGPVLVAAMYLLPSSENGPMPYGCLVQWHAHTNLCTSSTTHQIVGFTPCAPGTFHDGRTPYMTHVWQVPVAGGPLAIGPSDLQVVQAAMMAQQDGQAPSSPGTL